tara:strand:+ start:815 stop:1189 length:375 start_codon:yes stop_codon:yes gene_type:complete
VAAAAEFRIEESEVCIAVAVVEAGTVMMTVMSTMRGAAVSLPGATTVRRLVPIVSTVTAEVRTLVSRATFSWTEEELTVPLTVRSSLTFSFEGGGDGDLGDGGGGKGGGGGEGENGGETPQTAA